MSASLSAERDRIQRQVEELEQSLYVNDAELDLLSSETGDESDDEDDEDVEDVDESADLKEQREKIQREIQNLEDVLGEADVDDSSSDESELGLPLSVDSCLQMNLVYQQVLQETLDQLEVLLTHNVAQQKELMSQLSGPIKEHPREQTGPSSYQQPNTMYLGRFLKPYFKDKLTGLGPPANPEARDRSSRMTGVLDNNRLKFKRWESWQKTLLFKSVTTDQLKRLVQPKLSRVEYLSHKLPSAEESDRQQLKEQIDSLEKEISLLRGKKEEELMGERHDEHDWEKISNIDFEGTREAADIRCFWQNFLHPSINKGQWSREEVQQLKEISRRRQEQHWEEIAQELGTGRTAFMCLQTFQRFISESLRRSSWTRAEDDLLRQLVEKMRIGNFIPYTQMSYFMEGRQPSQLVYRWNQVLDPNIKRGMWTKEEDQLLLQAVARYGEKNWWKIRLEVPGRTCTACRDRYLDCLKAGTKRGPFDQQEIDLLVQLVKKHGVGHWTKIAAEIPQRIDCQCLRAWRALGNDPEVRELAKAKRRARLEARRAAAQERVKKVRRRRVKVKVKEEEISDDEEEEETVVHYMDSDDDTKKKKLKVALQNVEEEVVPQTVEEEVQVEVKKEEEEVEEEYSIPPMQDWIPASGAKSLGLKFLPAALPSHATACGTPPIRSTILRNSGVSVVDGPPPRVLPSNARHRGALMMATAVDLRAYLTGLAYPPSGMERPRRHPRAPSQICYRLMAAVTPWIGNLLIETAAPLAGSIRERVETTLVPSGAVFQLLLQSLQVDVEGCRQMIRERREFGRWQDLLLTRRYTRKQIELQQQLLLKQLWEVQLPRRRQPPPPQQQRRLLLLQSTSSTPPRLLLQGHQVSPQVAVPRPTPQIVASPAPPPAPRTLLLAPTPRLQDVSSTLTNEQAAPGSAQQPPRESMQEEAQKEVQDVSCSTHKEAEVVKNHLTSDTKPVVLPPPQHLHPSPPPPAPGTPPPPLTSHLSVLYDHQYINTNGTPERRCRNLKRQREEEQQQQEEEAQQEETQRSTQDVSEGEPCPGAVQEGKRFRKPSEKAQALLETTRAKAEAKKRRLLHSPKVSGTASRVKTRSPRSGTPQVGAPRSGTPQVGAPPLSGPHLNPSQPMWVMSPAGLVQLTPTSPQNLPVVLISGPSGPLPPGGVARPVAPPTLLLPVPRPLPPGGVARPVAPPTLLLPVPSPLPPGGVARPVAPPTLLLPVPNKPPNMNRPLPSGSSPLLFYPPRHASRLFPPHPAAVAADPASPHPLGTEDLLFDRSLMSLEPAEAVCEWLGGKGGVPAAGTGLTLPYLPPFLSNLSALSALLRVRNSLRREAVQVLVPDCRTQNLQTGPGPSSAADPPRWTPPDLPDSTWDLEPVQPGPCDGSEKEQQEEMEQQQQQEEEEQPQEQQEEESDQQQQQEEEEQQEDEQPQEQQQEEQSQEQQQEEQQEEQSREQQEEEEQQEHLVEAVRHLVSERFSSNPAYQLLKARFLSCFTLPALLATVQPVTEESKQERNITEIVEAPQSDEESVLLSDVVGSPANHFSGMDRSTPDRTGSNQTGSNQTGSSPTESRPTGSNQTGSRRIGSKQTKRKRKSTKT